MTFPSGGRLLVLHALRLKGYADEPLVATATGLSASDVEDHLGGLAGDGLAHRREGRLSGWALTSAGRAEHGRLLAAELAEAGCADEVDAAYRSFLGLNGTFLAVATAWQVRDDAPVPVANDHADAAYDAGVVDRLGRVHAEIVPLTGVLAACLARFAPYEGRLRHALERVRAGDVEWFARPLIDSYHTVWFELHEDLLATLGRERAAEETRESLETEVHTG